MEQSKVMVCLATNRPFDLDEAMHRRISASFEFRAPDHIDRAKLWRSHLTLTLTLTLTLILTLIVEEPRRGESPREPQRGLGSAQPQVRAHGGFY